MSYDNCPFFTIFMVQRHWKIHFPLILYNKFVKKYNTRKGFFYLFMIKQSRREATTLISNN
jgi:hypothetical protein